MKTTPKQYAQALLSSTSKDNISKVAEKFWYQLQKTNSYKDLNQILSNLEVVQAEKEGKILTEVYSPSQLREREILEIENRIKSKFGQEAYIISKIDPALKLGYRIEAAGKVFDNTFSGKLRELKNHIS